MDRYGGWVRDFRSRCPPCPRNPPWATARRRWRIQSRAHVRGRGDGRHRRERVTLESNPQGVGFSPIWERKGGSAAVRATRLPADFATRYFVGGGAVVLGKTGVRTLVAELMRWMVQDPGGAAAALEDTLEVWTSEDAPLRPLESPYGGHYKLLSLMLADIARKADAGLDTLDWIASLGLPVEAFREDDDPPASEIHTRMDARMDAMWAQEDAWLEEGVLH